MSFIPASAVRYAPTLTLELAQSLAARGPLRRRRSKER
jgi:hypothetical protein